LASKKLAQSDGPLIEELLQARADQYKGTGERRKAGRKLAAEIGAKFDARSPFPETTSEPNSENTPQPGPSLEVFLANVRMERNTFESRIVPDQTVCKDMGGETYGWPDGDPAAVSRRYCLEVTQGGLVAGELLKRACVRTLGDLETGHTRGLLYDPWAVRHIVRWCEDFCGLKLEPWEQWILGELFGWKRPTGYRRYTEAWISCGKKQGKTALCGCIGLFALVADQEKYAEVFSAATKLDQAKLIYRDAARAVENNAELRAAVRTWKTNMLQVEETGNTFQPLSSDEKSSDGLRPHFLLLDELHEWVDRGFFEKLVKGNVIRKQPLTVAITTAGATRYSFAWTKYDLADKILRGVYNEPSTFVAIYSTDAGDDYHDERNWRKSCPNLGVTVQIEHLRKQLAEVDQDPSALNGFIRYVCNNWVDASLCNRSGTITAEKWDLCRGPELMERLGQDEFLAQFLAANHKERCFGGLDVGLKDDLSAFVMLWPQAIIPGEEAPVRKRVCLCQFFIPEYGLLQKEKDWQVPLSAWARQGWLEVLPGDMTDVREIKKAITKMCGDLNMFELGYDTWNAAVMCAELTEAHVVKCVIVPQTLKEMTTPCKEFLRAVWGQEFWHLDNPILKWMSGNAILQEDEKWGGIKPEKKSPGEKIDGISALLNAWHRMLSAPAVSNYTKRGIVFI
jgi:phage terminase large subunit-like protein